MGILIIHADHDTTTSEWERIRSLVESVNGYTAHAVVEPSTVTAVKSAEPVQHMTPVVNDERLHDPQGEYDDATWQSFSPQKRGSIKRHRNGNDAPFVAARTAATPVATPATDAMTELFAAAGLDVPEQPASVPAPEPTLEPVAVVKNVVNLSTDLTVAQRTDLGIWAHEKLADPNKIKLVDAFLAGKITLTQAAAYPTKSGKSNLALDIARVVKCELVNA